MILRFYAKADALQPVPGFEAAVGDQPRYVGRRADPENPGAFPATEEPYECDSGSPAGQRLAFLAFRDRDIWPADEATAEFCRVPFVATELIDGERVAVAANAPKKD